jgi:hypothetical protein
MVMSLAIHDARAFMRRPALISIGMRRLQQVVSFNERRNT